MKRIIPLVVALFFVANFASADQASITGGGYTILNNTIVPISALVTGGGLTSFSSGFPISGSVSGGGLSINEGQIITPVISTAIGNHSGGSTGYLTDQNPPVINIFVYDVSMTGAVVYVITDRPVSVYLEYESIDGVIKRTPLSGIDTFHVFAISDLAPGTSYKLKAFAQLGGLDIGEADVSFDTDKTKEARALRLKNKNASSENPDGSPNLFDISVSDADMFKNAYDAARAGKLGAPLSISIDFHGSALTLGFKERMKTTINFDLKNTSTFAGILYVDILDKNAGILSSNQYPMTVNASTSKQVYEDISPWILPQDVSIHARFEVANQGQSSLAVSADTMEYVPLTYLLLIIMILIFIILLILLRMIYKRYKYYLKYR